LNHDQRSGDYELGYHVTLVNDATPAFSRDRMRAAHQLNAPNLAHVIFTTKEPLSALRDSKTSRESQIINEIGAEERISA
jgi:hypothetical protein